MLQSRKFSVAALAVAAALLMTGCSSAGAGDKPSGGNSELTHLNVASIDVDGTIPLLIAEDEGIFEKHGLEVESTLSPAFDGTLASVMNGQADIGFAASPPMIRAMVKGAPIRAVAQTAAIDPAETQAAVIATDPALKSPLDLIGKKVAVSSLNDLASIGIRISVAAAGGNPDDVQFVELPGAQRLPALTEGRVDAAIFIGASAVAALKTDGVHLMFQYTEGLPDGSPLDVYFSKSDYIDNNSDVLQRFRDAMDEATTFANENPEIVREHVRQLLTDVPNQAAVVDEMNMPTYNTLISPEALEKLQDELMKFGGLEKDIPADQFFSFTSSK